MNSGEDLALQSMKIVESVLVEGRLLVELNDVVMEDTEHKDRMNKNIDKHRVCVLCNKTFKSPKALGGHTRIHYQNGKKKSLISKNKMKAHLREKVDRRQSNSKCEKKKSTTFDNCAVAVCIDERPSCPVCRKKFPSLKSVFGHMRKHPDRNWRGSRPPLIEKTSPGSCLSYEKNPESEKDGAVDLTIYLRGWNSTARRGRKRLSLEMDDVHELKELEAAAGLMVLMGGGFESVLIRRQKDDEFEDEKSKPGFGKSSIRDRDQFEEKGYDVNLNDDIKNLGSKLLIKNKKKREKKRLKLSDLQQPQNAAPITLDNPVALTTTSPFSEKYRRGTCDKSSHTRQAFGGHISGHKKFTAVINNFILKSESPSKQMEETNENISNLVEKTICNKSRSWHEIDLNKLPALECEVEVGSSC